MNPSILISSGFPQALKIMENLEINKKRLRMEKSWNLKKINNHEKILEFEKNQ